jgi:hypothetical protein
MKLVVHFMMDDKSKIVDGNGCEQHLVIVLVLISH